MCTAIRFTDAEGSLYFARNLDWCCGYGEKVVLTPTGVRPVSPHGAIDEVAYPVIGMGIPAGTTPLYYDCANDRGLAVAGLNFPGYARYEESPVEGKVNVAAFEFPLWIAGQHASVDEVEQALANVAIVGTPLTPDMPASYLHWIIGDSQRSIVVEYTDQGMQVFHDDFDVLANQPGFGYHAENVRSYLNVTPKAPTGVQWGGVSLEPYGCGGGMRGLPGDYYSPSRFVRAAYLNAHYPVQNTEPANVTRMFRTLEGVSMIEGAAQMADGQLERTIFTSGFSARTNTYHYSTYEDPTRRAFSMADYPATGTELVVCE
ncbi:MAG: choloylglycine hydrolase [Coriobacteriia bacterium]|nr:choloylglycine hydrolase [Coriobacteriia bacterium]